MHINQMHIDVQDRVTTKISLFHSAAIISHKGSQPQSTTLNRFPHVTKKSGGTHMKVGKITQPSFCFAENTAISELQHLCWIKISISINPLQNENLDLEDFVQPAALQTLKTVGAKMNSKANPSTSKLIFAEKKKNQLNLMHQQSGGRAVVQVLLTCFSKKCSLN